MVRASIISMAAGTIPSPMIPETASPASSVSLNAAKSVLTDSGLRTMRSVILVAIPNVPSEPTNAPIRSYPGAEGPPRPAGNHPPPPHDGVRGKPFFQKMSPPVFFWEFPADGGDDLARR